jgi:hypothetical protein
MAHLFLSHSSADDGFVRELRQALADLGQEVWIDSRQLKGGDPLWSAIQAAIEAAGGLAVLVSPKAFESDWVARELKHGLKVQAERGLAAFPVFLLALNGTKPGSLAGYFDEKPIYIPVSSAPGGATAAIHEILVVLGLRLPTERPPVPSPGRSRWRSWCSNSATSPSMSRTACAAPPPAPAWSMSPPPPASRRW